MVKDSLTVNKISWPDWSALELKWDKVFGKMEINHRDQYFELNEDAELGYYD